MTTTTTQPSVELARQLLSALLPNREPEHLPLQGASGRILARDLTALVSHPSATESALDGVACRAADTQGASRDSPVWLRLVGSSWAGEGYAGPVGPGEAARVATGGMLPPGTDAICPLEEVREVDGGVELYRPASTRDVRREASDFAAGDIVLHAGETLRPSHLAVAAALGHAAVAVQPAYRVGLLSTGSEVRPVGGPLARGEVYNSNAFGLAALLRADGHRVCLLGHVQDTRSALVQVCQEAGAVDLILTSGGASVGQRDVVRTLLRDDGEVVFTGVRMRPGKGMLAGRYLGVPLIGLPGNPVASLVAYEAVVRPALSHRPLPVWQLRSGSAFRTLLHQTAFWRGVVQGGLVFDQKEQGAGAMQSLAASDVLVIVPEGQIVEAGTLVDVIPVS